MSNLNYNKITLAGRVATDPELKQTNGGVSVVSFRIAVRRRFQKQGEEPVSDFINVVAWRQTAEFVSRYFHKGSAIMIDGSLQSRQYTDQQGNNRTAYEVVVDDAMFVDSRNESPSAGYGDSYGAPAYSSAGQQKQDGTSMTPVTQNTAPAPRFEPVADNDDLPF